MVIAYCVMAETYESEKTYSKMLAWLGKRELAIQMQSE